MFRNSHESTRTTTQEQRADLLLYILKVSTYYIVMSSAASLLGVVWLQDPAAIPVGLSLIVLAVFHGSLLIALMSIVVFTAALFAFVINKLAKPSDS